jgi:hypothetical protein
VPDIAGPLGSDTFIAGVPFSIHWLTPESDKKVPTAEKVVIEEVQSRLPAVQVDLANIETTGWGSNRYLVKFPAFTISQAGIYKLQLWVNDKVVATTPNLRVGSWEPIYLRFSVASGYLYLSGKHLKNHSAVEIERGHAEPYGGHSFIVLENDIPHAMPRAEWQDTQEKLIVHDPQLAHSNLSRTFIGVWPKNDKVKVSIPRWPGDTWPWEVTLRFAKR